MACLAIPASMFVTGTQDVDREDPRHGGFADIFKASNKGRLVALKRLRLSEATRDDRKIQEVYLLRTLGWKMY